MEKPRANKLGGKEWMRNSISIWSDCRKTVEERRLGHPASFPVALVEKLIKCYLPPGERSIVYDPFCGSGSTMIASMRCGITGYGTDINKEYVSQSNLRIQEEALRAGGDGGSTAYCMDAVTAMTTYLQKDSIDLIVTSPPYWDVLSRKRTQDKREEEVNYSILDETWTCSTYESYIYSIGEILSHALAILKPKSYCIINVMDLRKKSNFYPVHADVARDFCSRGWILQDIIIWDRRQDYNNFGPIGYPTIFYINKAHEYLLVFRSPNG